MAITIQDTFTGTAGTSLVDHTPDSGGTIELMAFSTSDATEVNPAVLRDVSGELTLGTSGTGRSGAYRYSTDPGADNYILRCTWSFHTAQSNRFTWMMWRMTSTGTADGDVDRYMLVGDALAAQWELYKTVGGSANRVLLDVAGDAAIPGGVFAVRVETLSTGQFCYVDDVLTVSSADVTITQRGRAGVGISRANSSTQWADNFSVDSVSSGAVTGSLAETQDDQTLAASGSSALGVTGSLVETQADQTLSATGQITYTGTLSQTQQDQTLAASGAIGDVTTGALAEIQADNTLAAAGQIIYTGTLAVTQEAQALNASGWINAIGELAVIQIGQVLAASGTTFTPIGGMPGLIHGKPPMPGAVEITVKSILGGIT